MQYKDFATKEEELKVMRFYQNDLNSAKLLINVTHDKVVTDFSTATKVQIAFLKPDGKRVFQDVQNVNQMQGKYYVVLSTQTLIAYGNVVAQLRLTFPNNKVIETCKFVFAVDESIMSDTAMESTNEFPVIQKAIEAGKKLEGVDINGIIAAGAKADAALPKAGGTMTGNLLMTNTTGAISQRYQAGATPVSVGWEALTNGQFRLYDWTNGRNVFSYDPVTDTINVNRNTNVLKISGGTMLGDLAFNNANNGILLKAGANTMYQAMDGNGDYYMYSSNGKTVAKYVTATDTFNMNAANSNLLKKTGDTMTGAMTFDTAFTIRGSASSWEMRPYASGVYSKGVRHTMNTTNNFYAIAPIDAAGSATWANQVALYGDTGVFDVKDLNIRGGSASNVVTKIKDGRVSLALTADAANIDGVNIAPVVDRRGNTVTIRAAIRRTHATGSTVLTTLPVDMRPIVAQHNIITATDGTRGRLQIAANGELAILDVSGSAQNKDFYFTATYVVD
ncbi:hypothetical protein CN417_28750 [Bacillus thuringiensis]|nr:hypothetical protein CN417_28750 [Bacillus thuringiensis]